MRALLPKAATDVDLVDAYATPVGVSDDQPFVRCNMISSLDGAIAVMGRSGLLGGPADGRVFQALRSVTDVILVGAGTARAEGYGPVRLDEELRRRRAERGQPAVPPIAIVTRSGMLDWSSPFFVDAEARPIVFLPADVHQDVFDRGREVADLVVAGQAEVDPRRAIGHLGQSGYRSVLVEGGPGLNAELVQNSLLDELCLTLAPCVVAGSGPRVLAGPELPRPLKVEMVHLLEEDGFLFYRMALERSVPG